MGWGGHVARIGEQIKAFRILLKKNQKERGQLEDLGVGGRITLRCMLKK